MKADQARSKFGKATRDVNEVITPQTIPYFYWKEWNNARLRGEFAFLWDMTHVDGDYRGRFSDQGDFLVKAQSHPLPGGPDWHLKKIKVDEKTAHLLSIRGEDDPRTHSFDVEMMHLVRIPEGWRLFDVKTDRLEKDSDTFLSFDIFGVETAELAHHKRVVDGFERPDLADRPDEEDDDEDSAGDAGPSAPETDTDGGEESAETSA